MHAEDHDISQGDVAELDEHDEIWDDEDWMKDLPPPEEAGGHERLQEAGAERPPPDGEPEWREEEPSAPPSFSQPSQPEDIHTTCFFMFLSIFFYVVNMYF